LTGRDTEGGCRHDVPFVSQDHVARCGDAAVRMLVGWHKGVVPAAAPPSERRTSAAALMEALRAEGLRPLSLADRLPRDRRWTAAQLARHLRDLGPIICAGTMHHVVLVGVDEERVLLHDPWRGRALTRTLAELDRFLWWGDRDCMIAARA
jgi:hypothetical protein